MSVREAIKNIFGVDVIDPETTKVEAYKVLSLEERKRLENSEAEAERIAEAADYAKLVQEEKRREARMKKPVQENNSIDKDNNIIINNGPKKIDRGGRGE